MQHVLHMLASSAGVEAAGAGAEGKRGVQEPRQLRMAVFVRGCS